MNKIFTLCLLLPIFVRGQVILTIAGNGLQSNGGDGGPATAAQLYIPGCGAFDHQGNLYIQLGSGNKIRKISPSGIISTVAGTGTSGYNGDGLPATAAQLNLPEAVAVDSLSNLYIADDWNNRIRKVDHLTGMISTIAGTGVSGYSGDGGLATAAKLNNPQGICTDKFGNLYIADDLNHVVRKINTSGIIVTVAGTGVMGYNGDNIVATNAQLTEPVSVCVDNNGNLYIGDISGRIRKVNTSGIISTIAGTGSPGYGGDGGPATNAKVIGLSVAVDKFGNLFLGEGNENRVRKINSSGIINTIAGDGSVGFSGDGDLASFAKVHFVWGIAIDSCGNIYFGDQYNYRIRKITYPHCHYLDIENEVVKNEHSIYPNPTYDLLSIDNLKTQSTYHLLNLLGASMQQDTLKAGNNNISLQALPPGMYMLELTDNEGKRTVHKIIKQ